MTYASPLPTGQAIVKGWRAGDKGAVPSVICHRMRAAGRLGLAVLSRCDGMAIMASRKLMTEGKSATGRAFCLPNRASPPSTSVGLLRRAWLGVRSDGAADARAMVWSDEALRLGAGAPDVKALIGVPRASRRASPPETGPLRPLKPCMNGLPAHAPVILDRRFRPVRLYACPTGAGFEKLL